MRSRNPAAPGAGANRKGAAPPAAQDAERLDAAARQLAIVNEQSADQTVRSRSPAAPGAEPTAKAQRRLTRTVLGVRGCGLVRTVLLYTLCVWVYKVQPRQTAVLSTTSVTCRLGGETHAHSVSQDEIFNIRMAGGDARIADHLQTERYNDADLLTGAD